ncbi:MAG TPA: fibronectin type III domain-containing protein [Verrucomicrobiae bacterium]|nr:fibronectin type III domain-containing protein [Verrucomicrobiae bacterium]
MLTALCLAVLTSARAIDETWEYSVQVSATVQSSPAQIHLTWPQDTWLAPSSYTVYRKLLSDTSWGAGTILSGGATDFIDTNVVNGSAYEYQIVKVTSQYTGYGYIYAGINVPLTESRGTMILIVDDNFSAPLTNQLFQLEQDLVGDGWTVLRHDVSTNDSVEYVKSLIQSDYNSDPADVNTVFLFGHIPVPYSGDIAPDEHVPAHQGAWPADVYYGNLFGNWTDYTINDAKATDPRNWNVPGDGKFDQSSIPGQVQLMVGRVDLHNLPGVTYSGNAIFPSEQTLLANYLTKDHNFRQKVFNLPRLGVVGDFFGNYGGEAFAASGWRNFAPFFGAQNVLDLTKDGTWISTLNWDPFLWSYGCGPGDWNTISDLGNDDKYYTAVTPDFAQANIQTVFTMLFGSYFGDWDVKDDLMRGVLAAPSYTLACLWSGSPHWYCHHMALGQTLGFATRLTQNNGPNGLYKNQVMNYAGLVHIALMGDPTLRMHVVGPPANLSASASAGNVQLIWNGSSDSIAGYNIYRSSSPMGPFTRLNNQLVAGTSYTDTNPSAAAQSYMVRAVKLENTPSGTYYNQSQGIFSSPIWADPFFTGEASLGNDWYYLGSDTNHIFGYYSMQYFPYVFHWDMGWEYYIDAGDAGHGAYFYDFTDDVFFYTAPGVFPYIYDFNVNAWMFYDPLAGQPGRYTSNPRWFYNLSTQAWGNHL